MGLTFDSKKSAGRPWAQADAPNRAKPVIEKAWERSKRLDTIAFNSVRRMFCSKTRPLHRIGFVINTLRCFCFIVFTGLLLGAAEQPKPQKAGIRTPGIQIPFSRLKAEQEFAVAAGARWVGVTSAVAVAAGKAEGSLARIDMKAEKAGDPVAGVGTACAGAAEGFDSWWVADCTAGAVVRVNGKEGKVIVRIATGVAKVASGIATTADSVWLLSDSKTTLTRVDPAGNNVVSELRLPSGCSGLAAGEGALWVACPAENRVLRINTVSNIVEERIEVAAQPSASAVGEGSVWVLCRKDGKVDRIDPKTNKVTKSLELNVPDAEGAIATGGGSVWVTMAGFPLTRIDPAAGKERVAQQFAGEGGGAVQFGFGSVLLVNSKAGTLWKIDPKRIAATLAE
jgi:streptogramin lyase